MDIMHIGKCRYEIQEQMEVPVCYNRHIPADFENLEYFTKVVRVCATRLWSGPWLPKLWKTLF
jgi:hypothetical protein